MAKRKPKPRLYKPPSYGKIKDVNRPKWMKVFYIMAMILASAVAVSGIIGAVIKYYRLVTK